MANHTYEITMPSLGADMSEGTLVEWQIKIGDQVKKGDIVAVIETQKGAIDMEIYQDGKVSEIIIQPDTTVPVGTVLARLVTDTEIPVDAHAVDKTSPLMKSEPPAEYDADNINDKVAVSRSGIIASPVVRKLAQQHQIDLSGIKGSGPSGAIQLRDINVSKKPSNPVVLSPADAMRKAIATAMEKSKREIPHYYLTLDIDITHVQHWLQKQNAEKEPQQRMLLLAILLKAIAQTLIKYPQLNGYYMDGRFSSRQAVHIGNVISLREGGLVVPAMHNVDKLSLTEVMDALRDISERSRGGHLRSSELTDATITVTSMGERGSDSVLGVIYPPQVAIIGFGRPRTVPQVKDGEVVIGELLTASLSADHRVSDGIVGAKFLNALAKTLQKPENL